METLIVSAVLLVSLLLIFQMLSHFQLWWTRQEKCIDRTATARYVLHKISDLLFMAGYKPSVKGIHAIGPSSLTVEYLVEDAEEVLGQYSRHRLFTVCREGERLKLITRRRRLPLDGLPSWGEGSTSVLAEGVREVSFRYLDAAGRDTEAPEAVRMVEFTLRLDDAPRNGEEQRYRTSVFLRNLHG